MLASARTCSGDSELSLQGLAAIAPLYGNDTPYNRSLDNGSLPDRFRAHGAAFDKQGVLHDAAHAARSYAELLSVHDSPCAAAAVLAARASTDRAHEAAYAFVRAAGSGKHDTPAHVPYVPDLYA